MQNLKINGEREMKDDSRCVGSVLLRSEAVYVYEALCSAGHGF